MGNETATIGKGNKMESFKTECQFVEFLGERKGSEFISFKASTVVEFLKKNRMTKEPAQYRTGDVVKVTKVNVQIGADYSNLVNNQRRREDKPADFVSEGPRWGKTINGWPLLVHVKGGEPKAYLRCSILRSYGVCYEVEFEDGTREAMEGKPCYIEVSTGRIINPDFLYPIMKKPSRAKKQDLEQEIVWRTYGLEGINEVNMRKGKLVLPASRSAAAS